MIKPRFMRKLLANKKLMIIIGVVVVVGIIAGALMFRGGTDETPPGPPPVYHSQLTGNEVDQEISERPVLGIIIENTPEARPQTGLGSAGIVFEAITEGGITRYLALYQDDMPGTAGPVRSLRTHLLDWAMGFDASFAHVGGSPEAINLAQRREAKSLNQFNYSDPYFRTNDRQPPHNMYARVNDLVKLQGELDHGRSQFADIPRTDDAPSAEANATRITIDFSFHDYLTQFRYNADDNVYTRYLAGQPHRDQETNNPIRIKNLVVVVTKVTGGRVSATGQGKAFLFNNGRVQEIKWQKPSHEERIRFVDDQDAEVPLLRGKSWVSVITDRSSLEY